MKVQLNRHWQCKTVNDQEKSSRPKPVDTSGYLLNIDLLRK